jgi:hypothetical protein
MPALLLLTLLGGLALPTSAVEPWATVRAKLERAKTTEGQQEVARAVGLAWVAHHLEDFGLTAGAFDVLEGGNHPLAQTFGRSLTALGGAAGQLQVVFDR